MRRAFLVSLVLLALLSQFAGARSVAAAVDEANEALLTIRSRRLGRELKLDGIFYETSAGRQILPRELNFDGDEHQRVQAQREDERRRVVTLSVRPAGANHFKIRFSAEPDADLVKWGLAVDALGDEYYTGLMERVIDGPQRVSWAPGIREAMDLHGQKVEMVVKPTTSVYAPFYISSRGYGVFVKGTWRLH